MQGQADGGGFDDMPDAEVDVSGYDGDVDGRKRRKSLEEEADDAPRKREKPTPERVDTRWKERALTALHEKALAEEEIARAHEELAAAHAQMRELRQKLFILEAKQDLSRWTVPLF